MKGLYSKGLILLTLGGAGMAENISSGRGSYLISAIIFGIGFILILASYEKD